MRAGHQAATAPRKQRDLSADGELVGHCVDLSATAALTDPAKGILVAHSVDQLLAARTLATAIVSGQLDLHPEQTLHDFVARWVELPGIGA